MSFVSFEIGGRSSYGVWKDEQTWIQAPSEFEARYPDLKSVIAADRLDELDRVARTSGHTVSAGQARLLPVIPNPGKILCVGLNYKSHVAETKRPDSEYPAIFTRYADSLLAHSAKMLKPKATQRFDFEAELAVIIGKGGRAIPQARAFEHIAGYACFNDGTARDWQRHTHQWTPGKNFPATGPFGPYMATPSEIPDVNRLTIASRLNGQVMQKASLADLIYTLPVIIEYLSGFTPLSAGDVIATGTPGGVGDRREPPVYMKAGDVIEIEITGLGVLRNVITDEA
ncbi:5-carboxymethyl-2-hydroxymuconate isomerase [Hylemonella gracilis str. Niagara R]|uniref:5-carboxymethyl-2-hydroxymuconate isomerase n=1 Tax=Hylemonella gracilis str. Niagara R TaxID=1458275 RepID=A0A016XMU5_9BURK|nr:fumarylacetoacetate hydrolase family protein [Hylemonella gracilis]EYC52508.1 5-carboxymethyl-2-hydroxymuconate isomerase [Hylemonella gracilis str. Niagara R]